MTLGKAVDAKGDECRPTWSGQCQVQMKLDGVLDKHTENPTLSYFGT